MKYRLAAALLLHAAFAAHPALAQTSPFPAGRTYIIEMTSSQVASGYAEYLVPPLRKAFDAAGLVYRGRAGSHFAATLSPTSDVGQWFGSGDGRRWLYARSVEVGLTPASQPATPPEGQPAFAVTARLITPDADRVDELNCLVALAVRTMAARYRLTGRVTVDGAVCLRK
jgi:hypothetical protein